MGNHDKSIFTSDILYRTHLSKNVKKSEKIKYLGFVESYIYFENEKFLKLYHECDSFAKKCVPAQNIVGTFLGHHHRFEFSSMSDTFTLPTLSNEIRKNSNLHRKGFLEIINNDKNYYVIYHDLDNEIKIGDNSLKLTMSKEI